MKFAAPARRDRGEMNLPMVNVVFLLLIFLMLMGKITERPEFDLTTAESQQGEEIAPAIRIFVGRGGEVQFGDSKGEDAVLSAVQAKLIATADRSPLIIRADAGADFKDVLTFADRFKQLPHGGVQLEVQGK